MHRVAVLRVVLHILRSNVAPRPARPGCVGPNPVPRLGNGCPDEDAVATCSVDDDKTAHTQYVLGMPARPKRGDGADEDGDGRHEGVTLEDTHLALELCETIGHVELLLWLRLGCCRAHTFNCRRRS